MFNHKTDSLKMAAYSHILTLLVSILQIASAIRTEQLGNDFIFDFEQKTCQIHITAKSGNHTIFSSDDSLLATGYGDVDTAKIMIAGNIFKFPHEINSTSHMVCDDFDSQPNMLSITGHVVSSNETALPFNLTF